MKSEQSSKAPNPEAPLSWKMFFIDQIVCLETVEGARFIYNGSFDPKTGILLLSQHGKQATQAKLYFKKDGTEKASLEGEFFGAKVSCQLARKDEHKLTLLSRGFHWINEFPFNK